jgi:hypothetical protein
MSWLKKSIQARNQAVKAQRDTINAEKEQLQRRIASWSSVTKPANEAVVGWNKFHLGNMILDINQSGILGPRHKISNFECVFSHLSTKNSIRLEYISRDSHKLDGWYGVNHNSLSKPYLNLNEGLESATGESNSDGYSFDYAGQYLFYETGEGDTYGEWTTIIKHVFGLYVDNGGLWIDDVYYDLSATNRNRRHIEGLVDSYLEARIKYHRS